MTVLKSADDPDVPSVKQAIRVFGHLSRPVGGTTAAELFDSWATQALYDEVVTFDVIGRALTQLAEGTGWQLDQPAKLYAPAASYEPGHLGIKFTYVRPAPGAGADYLSVAGLDGQPAEINLNGIPLTWPELCALMARDQRPLYFQSLVNPDWLSLLADREQELAEQSALDQRMAAQGQHRVACQWCDGEIFVPRTELGPHSCRVCARSCDGL